MDPTCLDKHDDGAMYGPCIRRRIIIRCTSAKFWPVTKSTRRAHRS